MITRLPPNYRNMSNIDRDRILQRIIDDINIEITSLSKKTDYNKLDSERGDNKVFYSNGSGTFSELALGAADTVLKSAGSTSTPEFWAIGTWSNWTPTYGSQSGAHTTITTGTSKYTQIGKIIFCILDITITAKGTAAGYLTFSLPATSSGSPASAVVTDRSGGDSGLGKIGTLSTTVCYMYAASNATPFVDNRVWNVCFFYESA